MRRMRTKINNWLTDQFNLPEDIIFNYPRITLVGDLHLYIENHQGLLKFESNEIEVRHPNGTVIVHGQNMVIKNLLKKEIVIEGKIDNVKINKSVEGGN
ncbi:sporulation protein YqfC [Bacillaceae bacterium W0354]